MTEYQILPASKSARAGRPTQAPSSRHILVVDDDGDIRRLNTEALITAGYKVEAAADGDAAWQALNHDCYDLMITDNNMPKLTGFELLQKLRAAHMTLPVIIASGTFFPQEPSPWRQPDAALLKPYTVEALLQTVRKILHEDSQPATIAELVAPNPPDNETAPAFVPHRPQAAHRILVVDQDHDLRQMYAEVLAGSDYQVDGAADGSAGWDALQVNPYHLLITAHDLPKLSGVELVKKVRAARLTLPIVITSDQWPLPELACDPALQLAATLMKPFATDTLVNTVQSVLRAPAPPAAGFPGGNC